MIEFHYNSKVSRSITLASVIVLASVMFVSAGSFLSVAPMTTVQYAAAQVEGEHGLGLTKVCEKVALGENNTCTFTARNIDDFGDSLTLNDAQDTMLAPYPGAPVTHTMSGGAEIVIISVTDNLPAGDTTCTVGGSLPCVIGPNDRVRFQDTSFVMSVAGNIPDTAAVSWTDNCDAQGTVACDPVNAQSATAGSTTVVINPSISVVKSLNTTKVAPGGAIEVTANVTNTGSVTLENVTATDSEAGALDCNATTLAAGESTLCTGTFNPTDSGSNTVTVEGAHQLGSVSDEDSEDFTVIDANISVVKSLNTTKVESGGAIEVTANVTNTGTVELTGINATDSEAGALDCNATTLAAGESTLCTGTFNPTDSGTNTVTVEGGFQLGTVSDEDSEDFTVINPSITVEKECSPSTQTAPGTITTTITTTNTGNVDLDVVVVDNVFGTLFNGTLAPNESNVTTITQDNLSAGTYSNTVNATGEHQLGTVDDSDSASCEVTQPAQTTRTPGYWATHLTQTNSVWANVDPAFKNWCTNFSVDSTGKVMGGFWSSISKESDNDRRSSLDQARMQLAQQLLAAILNNEAFNSSPNGLTIDQAIDDFCGTDRAAIIHDVGILDAFNNSGDNVPFPQGFVNTAADSKGSQAAATKSFWDQPSLAGPN